MSGALFRLRRGRSVFSSGLLKKRGRTRARRRGLRVKSRSFRRFRRGASSRRGRVQRGIRLLKALYPTNTIVNRTQEKLGYNGPVLFHFGVPYSLTGTFNPAGTAALETPWAPGYNTAISQFFTDNYTNADPDVNCQYQVHIMSEDYTYNWTNISNVDLNCTIYTCVARNDIPYYAGNNDLWREGDNMYTQQAPSNLFVAGLADTQGTGGAAPSFADITTTLFMSRQFCQTYKIAKVQTRKLRAGQTLKKKLHKGYSKHYLNEVCCLPTGLTVDSYAQDLLKRKLLLARKGAVFYVTKWWHPLGNTILGSATHNRVDLTFEVFANVKCIAAQFNRRIIHSLGANNTVGSAQAVNPDIIMGYSTTETTQATRVVV